MAYKAVDLGTAQEKLETARKLRAATQKALAKAIDADTRAGDDLASAQSEFDMAVASIRNR